MPLYQTDYRIPLTRWAVSFHRPARHQRGFWVDLQDAQCVAVGLGGVLLLAERLHCGALVSEAR